jgi:hypothetical protein
MRYGRWILLATLWLAVVPWSAAEECNGRVVTISIGETLVVSPESIEIIIDASRRKKRSVCFETEGLVEGMTVKIERKEGVLDLLPDLEGEFSWPQTVADSGLASATGTWTYSVIVLHEGTRREVDPEIVIKKKN